MDPIPNPFAPNHSYYDSDSVSCFVTDLFESRSSDRSRPCSCHDISINPFSGVVCDLHHGELGLGFGGGNDSVGDNSGGLRVVGFGSVSDSSSEEGELDRAMEFSSGVDGDDYRAGVGGAFDDFDVGLCWDSLCLEDQRTLLNESVEWEEVLERVNEVYVDGESVASGFTNGSEEAIRDLEWEIIMAVNNFERNSGLLHDDSIGADSYLAVPEGFFFNAEVDNVLFGQFLENDNGLKGSPPAAKSAVDNLPLVVGEELQGKNVMCAICKDEMVLEEKVRRLPCSHCYHGDCILPWLSIRNTCPVCRFELPTDDPDYEQSKRQRIAHELLELTAQTRF